MGLRGDRRWMLVDDDGQCLTQRTLPRMALIAPRFEGDDLVVDAPGMPRLHVPRWSGEGEWIAAQIFDDRLIVAHPCARASEWFSSFLGHGCRLAYLADSVVRPVQAPYDQPPWRVNLADSFPLLILGQASLDLLNEKLATPMTMARFRPNLVIADSPAHAEDTWSRGRIGEMEFKMAKACKRCAVVLVDPETAATGVEPLQTLAQYRKAPPPSTKVIFGYKALVTRSGVLRVGQGLELLAEDDAVSLAASAAGQGEDDHVISI